jgi:hypothetical protein
MLKSLKRIKQTLTAFSLEDELFIKFIENESDKKLFRQQTFYLQF